MLLAPFSTSFSLLPSRTLPMAMLRLVSFWAVPKVSPVVAVAALKRETAAPPSVKVRLLLVVAVRVGMSFTRPTLTTNGTAVLVAMPSLTVNLIRSLAVSLLLWRYLMLPLVISCWVKVPFRAISSPALTSPLPLLSLNRVPLAGAETSLKTRLPAACWASVAASFAPVRVTV